MPRRAANVLITIATIGSCALLSCVWPPRQDTPLYCDASTPCSYEGFPDATFCDVDGNLQGVGNTCIEPLSLPCSTAAECVARREPVCGLPEGVCRGCASGEAGDGECAEKNAGTPFCAAGACVTCRESNDCDASAPICADNECGACEVGAEGDAACAARDASAPTCVDGRCAECQVDGDCVGAAGPICDLETLQCRGCETHGECASGVCDRDGGSCIDEANLIYVAADGGVNSPACGRKEQPCGSIGGAQGGLAKVVGRRHTLQLAAGNYVEAVSIASGELVRFVGAGVITPPLRADEPALSVSAGSTVIIDGPKLADATGGNNADGIRCEGSSTLTLREATISGNAATGIEASNCTVQIERSTISGNLGGGVDIKNSAFTIQNNFIVSNGTAGANGSSFGGVSINNNGAVDTSIFDFNTVADSLASPNAPAAAVLCLGTPFVGSNNIVYLSTGGLASTAGTCTWTYSDIQGGAPGTGNLDLDPGFIDPAGNFHLGTASPLIDAADPAATLPLDFDGDSRPQGTASDIGADEVIP